MGQATVDLPDPLETPPVDLHSELPLNAADLASADDLLSQLAGDDIDRLLAEAETAVVPSSDTTALNTAIGDSSQLPIEQLVDQTVLIAAAADVEAEVTATIGQEPQDASAGEPEFLPPPTIEAQEAAALQAVLAAAAESIAELPPAPSIETEHEPIAEISDTSLAEANPVGADEAAALLAAESTHAEAVDHRSSPPVRFLQLLNAPVAWLGEPVRDALGKVALVTLFNAIAVIAYVVLFRGKHPH